MSFAHYLLQVNLYLIVFYGFYKLLLDKETYFTLNRLYLMFAGILSLSIPFIRLEWLTEQKAAQHVYTSVNWTSVLQQASIISENPSAFKWANILVGIYCAGIVFFLGRLVFNLLTVKKLIKNPRTGTAFSFFSNKIVDNELPQKHVIDVHEEAHVKQWHTLDILFFELVGIITWINPIIYLYKKSIKNIHEFLADEMAAEFQGDKAEYALLLVSKAFGISPHNLTNGFFNKSLIKKRIYMLQKERSKRTAVLKYGIFIPLFALFIVFSSATIRKNEELISISEQIPLEKPIHLVENIVGTPTLLATDKPKTTTVIDNFGDLKWKGFYSFVGRSLKYPEKAQENNTQGSSQIKFCLTEGEISNLSTAVKLGDECDEEVKNAILAYKDFKNVPNGKYTLKVTFRLPGSGSDLKNEIVNPISGFKNLPEIVVNAQKAPEIATKTADEYGKIFDFVSIEKQPTFPGGMKSFYKYLSTAIKYPEQAQANNVQGKVFLSFIVEKDGSLTDINITRGLGSGLDEEALRAIRESPKWYPGIQNGLPVRVKYNINVNFSLSPAEPDKVANIKIRNNDNLVDRLTGSQNQNKPLIILDGVTQDSKDALKNIDPNTIESISILKDERTVSLYGLKGKNGVLLITSKLAKSSSYKKQQDKDFSIDNKN